MALGSVARGWVAPLSAGGGGCVGRASAEPRGERTRMQLGALDERIANFL